MSKRNQHIGASLDDLLQETGESSEVSVEAVKHVIVWEIIQTMETEHISKAKMAEMMGTSRSSLDRLLDPDNTSVTLHTLINAARVVGKTLRIELA